MAEYLAYRVVSGAAQACCSLGMVQCMGGCGTSSKLGSRLVDLLLVYLFSMLGIVLLFYGGQVMKPLTSLGLVDCEGESEAVCIGAFTVYRLCCALVLYHVLLLLLTLSGPKLSEAIETGFLPARLILLTLLVLSSFFIGNSFFAWFRDISKIVSILYLLLQSVFLIDFAYEWSEVWVERCERSDDPGFWTCWLYTFTIVFLGLGVTLAVVNFSSAEDCGIAGISTIFSTLGVISLLILSLLPYFSNGSILTSSFISLYCLYLQWSDIHSQAESCWSPESYILVNLSLGLLYLSITVIRMAVRTSNEVSAGDVKPVSDSQVRAGVYYHLVMCAAAMYLAMLVTNWGSAKVSNQQLQVSSFGGWVSVTVEWVTMCLFLWSLLAPTCLPDRDFS